MSFLANWQPLRDENAHTALTFGFLRHAPVEHALNPWLTDVLERPVTARQPLTHESFWPSHPSIYEGLRRTEPDLAFFADDVEPLLIVVEAKPGFSQQELMQISREVVDAAAYTGEQRVALIMIGADRGVPAVTAGWEDELRAELGRHDLAEVEVELRYCSWARLGRAVDGSAENASAWRRYADDVLAQLLVRGLLGYNGGPMFPDLKDLTVANAIKLFNRTMIAARLLVIEVRDSPRFQAAGFTDLTGGGSFRMARDTYSTALNQGEDSFTTTVLLSGCRQPNWPPGAGAYIAFDLDRDDDPHIQVGAFHYKGTGPVDIVWAYSNAPPGQPQQPALAARDLDSLPHACVNPENGGEWVFAERAWRAGEPDGDVTWVLDRLVDASAVWEPGAMT